MKKKLFIEKFNEFEISNRGITNWPIWEKEISEFDWYYDTEEQCLFLEGEVIIKTEVDNYKVKKGDFVIFPKGLRCTWHVLKPVKKHYKFL